MPTKKSFVLHFPTPEDRAAFIFPQGTPTFFTEGNNPNLKTTIDGITTVVGGSGGATVSPEQDSDFTATVGNLYLVDVTHEGEDPITITVTPPLGPSKGDFFEVSDSRSDAGANNIVIDFEAAGQSFHGNATTSYTINVDKGYAKLVYTNSTIGWILAS